MALPSAVQWDNTPGGYHHARAYTDYLKKKYEDAIKTCDEGERKIREFAKTQNRDPASYVNLGMLMLLRGTCYYDNGNFDKALVEFNNVVKIRPYDRAGHYNVALALTRKGLYAEAIKEACRAVELDPTHAESEALYKWLKNKIIEEKRKPGKPAEDEP
jgi:tetratricopeptide (TPR) repeat protein